MEVVHRHLTTDLLQGQEYSSEYPDGGGVPGEDCDKPKNFLKDGWTCQQIDDFNSLQK